MAIRSKRGRRMNRGRHFGSGRYDCRPPPDDINPPQTIPEDAQRTVSGQGEPVPIIYGEADTGPLITAVTQYGDDLLLMLTWCIGPAEEIVEVKMNDEDVPASVNLTHYLGSTTQTADPTLVAAFSDYTDTVVHDADGTLIPVCYSVVRVPPEASPGFPRFTARIKGKKVYDPREVSHDINDSSTWEYSENPALCKADFDRDPVNGLGRLVDDAALEIAADFCDQTLGGEPRRTINLKLEVMSDRGQISRLLGEYASVFTSWADGELVYTVDTTATPGAAITADDIIEGSFTAARRGMADRPTVVRVEYTDKLVSPSRSAYATATGAGVAEGTVPRRESVIRMLGLDNYAEAYRYAVERLNALTLTDVHISFSVFDEGLELLEGDVRPITYPIGLTARTFRIAEVSLLEAGRWGIVAHEYNASVYSDVVVSDPPMPDTDLPDPYNVPQPAGLTVTEEVFQKLDGTYSSRMRGSWTAVTYPYDFAYRFKVTSSTCGLISDFTTQSTEAVTPPVEESCTYDFEISVVSGFGVEGTAATDSLLAQGKGLTPGDVPQLTSARVGYDSVKLTWLPAADIDIWRYEIRQGSGTWDSATLVERVDGLNTIITGLDSNDTAYTWQIKAIDSVGQYSTNAVTSNLTMSVPGNVSSLTGLELGGEVRLNWPAATGYVGRYIIKYGSTTGFSWSGSTFLDSVDALRYFTKSVDSGTWRFAIKAVDDNGRESTTEATADVVVTIDTTKFFVSQQELSNTSLGDDTSIVSYTLGTDTVFIGPMTETWNSLFTSNLNSYTNPLFSYHASGSSVFLSDSYDYGLELTGSWNLTADNITAINGAVTKYLELSTNGSSWDQHTTLPVQAAARYARVRSTTATTSTQKAVTPGVTVDVSVEAGAESGSDTSSASAAKTITLTSNYSSVVRLVVTPVSTNPRFATIDNVTTGNPTSFDVYVWDDGGTQTATTFNWEFEGV